ncbi:MAG: hypothetical protein K9L68_00050 [Spirochaetales bacterium]|nr:hypothetical protein [Spirochaetales bacterium]MCF7936969.1 hypothetical protein [Spirochaetales bacterium]
MPTTPHPDKADENTIRYKSQLSIAEDLLVEKRGMDKDQAKKLLDPAAGYLEEAFFREGWSRGLAVFISEDMLKIYRLPLEFDEKVSVKNGYDVRPLLPLFFNNGRFYLLLLNLHGCRLYHATRYTLQKIPYKELERTMEEVLKYDVPEKQIQFHTQTGNAAGRRAAVYHGQGVGTEQSDEKEKMLPYLGAVENRVTKLINSDTIPLLLAGDEHLVGYYRRVNNYHNLPDQAIKKNSKEQDPEEFHNAAWELLKDTFENSRENVLQRYNEYAGTDYAAEGLETILPAAFEGRIHELLVPKKKEKNGSSNPENFRLDFSRWDSETDLLEAAVKQTLLNNGKVVNLDEPELPGKSEAAAIF